MQDPGGLPAGSTYAADYRVRFDEAGPDGRIRTSTLLRYAQDVAWRHSEARGFDRAWYASRGLSWVVRSVSLELLDPIGMGETLRLTTRVIGHRRIWARRLAEAMPVPTSEPDARPAARIVTDWVILDVRGRPVRIPSDFGLDFASPELHGDILHAEPPAEQTTDAPSATLRIRVRPQDLDPVGHVNNAAYFDWLEEAQLAAGATAAVAGVPRTAVLEYLASAGPGDEVEIATWRGAAGWQARIVGTATDLVRASGTPG